MFNIQGITDRQREVSPYKETIQIQSDIIFEFIPPSSDTSIKKISWPYNDKDDTFLNPFNSYIHFLNNNIRTFCKIYK